MTEAGNKFQSLDKRLLSGFVLEYNAGAVYRQSHEDMRDTFIALSLKRKLAQARRLASIVLALIFLALFLNAGFTHSQATAWRGLAKRFIAVTTRAALTSSGITIS